MKPLRRLTSILLLAVFCLPFLAPLFALGQDVDAGLPACCRRNGQHHCSMMMMSGSNRPDPQAPSVGLFRAKCPCCPGMVTQAAQHDVFRATTADAIFAGLVSHPASVAQTESLRRIARDRSRQKRGPPVSSLAWQS